MCHIYVRLCMPVWMHSHHMVLSPCQEVKNKILKQIAEAQQCLEMLKEKKNAMRYQTNALHDQNLPQHDVHAHSWPLHFCLVCIRAFYGTCRENFIRNSNKSFEEYRWAAPIHDYVHTYCILACSRMLWKSVRAYETCNETCRERIQSTGESWCLKKAEDELREAHSGIQRSEALCSW